MSIPLVQNNDKDAINTSIIAIKRNIERINMLLGLSNSEEIDTSEFVKKSDIVDEVTVGNMQSVTSNAVYKTMLPDFSNAVVVIEPPVGSTNDKTYTCTSKGFVCGTISLQDGQPSYSNFYINDVRVARCCGRSGVAEGVDGIGLFPVKAGDVLKVTTETRFGSSFNPTKIYFLPPL